MKTLTIHITQAVWEQQTVEVYAPDHLNGEALYTHIYEELDAGNYRNFGIRTLDTVGLADVEHAIAHADGTTEVF